MVTTAGLYTDSRYRAGVGEGYDGVVRVTAGGYYGTGALLFDGRVLLTVAHLLADRNGAEVTVHFETAAGSTSRTVSNVLLHPQYQSSSGNNDLALLWLPTAAPQAADRYALYRDGDELGQVMTLAGYGVPGTGASGVVEDYQGPYLRLQAENRFEAEGAELKAIMGSLMSWSPLAGSQLVADFDNGQSSRDALGQLMGIVDYGQGLDEGMITPGDSGGPAFIDGRIAGIAAYVASLYHNGFSPDPDLEANGTFGELGFWQRVSHYQQWIDQSMRAAWTDAPLSPEEVQFEILEGDSGAVFAYFLVQFHGIRLDPEQWLSVDFTTRDGTARAGEDYIAHSGTLMLYPDETQAVIPVEIIGDTTPEPDETFYLDIFNPVGGSFPNGQVILSAVRTIVDDDGWWPV